jgi:glucosamine kinase
MNLLLADSGSTKTQWCFYQNKNWQLPFETLGINPYFWEYDAIIAELRQNVAEKLPEKPQKIAFYGAGCSNDTQIKKIKTAFQEVFGEVAEEQIEIHHDLLAAARALCLTNAGIACIAGTGSNACVYDGSKITHQPINVGFWLGDEGSGGFLGKTLVMKFLHQEMPMDIYQKFKEKYELSLESILENAYQKPSPNRYFASFSYFLSENLENEFCRNLVFDSFHSFLSKYVTKLPNAYSLPVHFVGSVACVFSEILAETLKKHDLQIGKLLKTPLEGLKSFYI